MSELIEEVSNKPVKIHPVKKIELARQGNGGKN